MQNKLVENWLINSSELGFTTPFVQLLRAEGYTVLHVSRGGAVEEGKDIIAKDKRGNVCCFQLKCGDITGPVWYKIKAQVDEMAMVPPLHPSLPGTPKRWQCQLVTNGLIPNAPARSIKDNSDALKSKGFMPTGTVARDELVSRFAAGFGQFFPAEPADLNRFMTMYCEHGDKQLDRPAFKGFFEDFLKGYDASSKPKRLQALMAAPVLASYLLTNKYQQGNYVEIFYAWILVLLTILYYGHAWGVAAKHINELEQSILGEIDQLYRHLVDDVLANERQLIDGQYGIMAEAAITYKLRCTELIGIITAYFNYAGLSNRELYAPEALGDKLLDMYHYQILVGEYQMSLLLNVAVINSWDPSLQSVAIDALRQIVVSVLHMNRPDGRGLPSPYHPLKDAVPWFMDMPENRIHENFHGRSYCLWPAILLLASLGDRAFLAEHWRGISYVYNVELYPTDPTDGLLWHLTDGEQVDRVPAATQSWAALQAMAVEPTADKLPEPLRTRRYLLPLYILAMPHRCTAATVMGIRLDQ